MPEKEVLSKAKILPNTNDLACPKHPGSEVLAAELYYSGFHNYRGYICRECADAYFKENVGHYLERTAFASQEDSKHWELVWGKMLEGEGVAWNSLVRGQPIIGPIELCGIGLLAYVCSKCGLVEGKPIMSKQAVSEEATASFKEKEIWVRCYEFMCGEGTVSIEPLSENMRKLLDSSMIYTCGSCGNWIGTSTGKEHYC